jgi:hypothetical protein
MPIVSRSEAAVIDVHGAFWLQTIRQDGAGSAPTKSCGPAEAAPPKSCDPAEAAPRQRE